MVRQGWNCSFWFPTIFCPFTPLTDQKIKILKKGEKENLEITSVYRHVPKFMARWYTVTEI